jgi:hypothetical protein
MKSVFYQLKSSPWPTLPKGQNSSLEHKFASAILNLGITTKSGRFLMRSKLAISALVAASLFGATAIASAQTEPMQPAPGASGQGNAGTGSKMAPSKMKSHNTKQGTTTGMTPQGMRPSVDGSKPAGRSTARSPSGNQ